MSPNILSQLVGAETTATIWSAVVRHYSKLSTTRVMHLHLADIEQTVTILNGLLAEYNHFDVVITSSQGPYTLEAAIFVLIYAEARINVYMRLPVGVNVARYEFGERNRDTDYKSRSNRFNNNLVASNWFWGNKIVFSIVFETNFWAKSWFQKRKQC
ncbi:hypothetical protein GQ457_03G016050 [Hibiscus cannabinus]